jgi:hypothetical protein
VGVRVQRNDKYHASDDTSRIAVGTVGDACSR